MRMQSRTRGLLLALPLVSTLAGAANADRAAPAADQAPEAADRAAPAPQDRPSPAPPAGGSGASLIASRLPRIAYRGGPFVRRPRIVTITFAGDDPAVIDTLARFGDEITGTDWWRAVSADFQAAPDDRLGDARPGRSVRLDEALPAAVRATDVETALARAAADGSLGALDADTLLLAYLPPGVDLGDAFHPRYCRGGARALHRALRLPHVTVPFAILPRCGALDELTATASHEIVEAIANPDPARPGFAFERDPATIAFTASGAEPVDPCGLVTMDDHRAIAGGFVVQRAWSNEAAARGHDPCVPSTGDAPYLALIPEKPVIRLPAVGDRVTMMVEAAADRAVSSWSVAAIDWSGKHDGVKYLDVALDRATVAPGEKLRLTITARRAHPKQQALIALVSTHGERKHVWPLAVMMR